MEAATHILNRVPCSVNPSDKSPHEMMTKRKPDLSYLRVWYCDAVVNLPKAKRLKGDPRGLKLKLVGFLSNGYKFIDP
jgi:hypothetical protein